VPDGLVERAARERVLERSHVELDRAAPPQRSRGDLQASLGLRERAPERVQDVPQVRARLRLV
jgi:hypothetical protein